jgi:hypothetical protein
LAIGTVAAGAMSVDFRLSASRMAARETALHQILDPVWYGGQLTPIVVQAAPVGEPSATLRAEPRSRPGNARAVPRPAPAKIG